MWVQGYLDQGYLVKGYRGTGLPGCRAYLGLGLLGLGNQASRVQG